jgi:putative ABC transport system ATP-binding protein
MTTTPPRTALASLSDVSHVYGRHEAAVHALRGVDLVLEPSRLVVVLGVAGAGKTTLLHVLGGLVPATSGRVVVAGYDLTGLTQGARAEVRRRAVGFVFGSPDLVPTLTARENVSLVAELTGEPLGDRVDEALAEVGLPERADVFPARLTRGEQQRAAVARALVTRPRVLLADEPTGALDPDQGREVLRLLQRAAREQDRAVVLATDDATLAGAADRVVRLRAGAVVEDALVADPVEAAEVRW